MMLAEGTEVEPKFVTFGTLHSTFPPEVLTLQDAATKTKRWPARSHVSAKATSDGDVQWQEQPSLLYTVHHRISTYWETFWRVLVSSMISTKDHESLNGVSIAGLWLLNLGDQSPLILAVGGSGCYILWYVVITIGHSVSFQCIWLHLVLLHLLSRMIRNVYYYNYSSCIIFMYPFRHHIEKKGRYLFWEFFSFFWDFFSFFGPLVPWSSNPLVPWSSRPPSSRPLIVWSPGPLVLWSPAPLVFWFPGPLFFFVPFF